MTEDQNSVEDEIATQDHDVGAVEANEENSDQSNAIQKTHDLEDKQEKNWKELRRKQRELEIREKAKDELIEKLLNSQLNSVKNAPIAQVSESDEFSNIAEDDYPTWQQTNRRIEKKAEAIAEKKYRELKEKEESSRFLQRLQSKYSDFDDIVNADSIALLEQKEPELAQTIAELKDPYKMGLQSYHYLKRMNVSNEVDNKRHAKEVEKKLEKNENTVQSPQAFNKRPMAQAFRLTESEKTKLYEEMMMNAGRAGFGY